MNHLAMQTTDDTKRQQHLKTVQDSAENLLDLLNDILDFSKIEAGQLQISPRRFNLQRLLEDIIATNTLAAKKRHIVLELNTQELRSEAFTGDDVRVRQILLNLVSNAIKFTRHGSVQVSVKSLDDRPDYLHFTVIDTGIGIPPEKHNSVFNSFEQADSSTTRQYGGTGLGLAICKQLTLLMGGSIWMTSEVGKGSAFHVELPLSPESNYEDDNQSWRNGQPVLPQLKGSRILVVDDNPVNRDVASMILEQVHHVKTASDGLEALSLLAEEYFDLVLMDVQMPFMNGLTTTKIIRAAEQGHDQNERLPGGLPGDLVRQLFGCHLTVIAMTAHAMMEDKRRCLDAGMDGYITKPFQPNELVSVLAHLMESTSSDRYFGKDAHKSSQEQTSIPQITS
jgi:CheY-like chemotaxis protein